MIGTPRNLKIFSVLLHCMLRPSLASQGNEYDFLFFAYVAVVVLIKTDGWRLGTTCHHLNGDDFGVEIISDNPWQQVACYVKMYIKTSSSCSILLSPPLHCILPICIAAVMGNSISTLSLQPISLLHCFNKDGVLDLDLLLMYC